MFRHMHVYVKEMVGPTRKEFIFMALVFYLRERVGDGFLCVTFREAQI